MTTEEKLNELFDLKCAVDVAKMDKQKLVDAVLTDEIKQKLADIDAEFETRLAAINQKIADLETEIKTDVLAGGGTIKGEYMMAMYVKGRTTWDTKALEGYVLAHPEISALRKTGDPSVTIKMKV